MARDDVIDAAEKLLQAHFIVIYRYDDGNPGVTDRSVTTRLQRIDLSVFF
jgi:hypothetical protein